MIIVKFKIKMELVNSVLQDIPYIMMVSVRLKIANIYNIIATPMSVNCALQDIISTTVYVVK